MQYITSYNDVDLRVLCGLHTPSVSGIHDLVALALNIKKLPGGSIPDVTMLPDDFRNVSFGALVVGDGHDGLVANLERLRGALRPDADFHPLVVVDRPTHRIMALCSGGFSVSLKELPNVHDVAQVTIPFLCYPYWEDLTERNILFATALLTFRQATFEHTALDGWVAYDTGEATVETTAPYDGNSCMKVVCSGDDGVETPERGIAVAAETDYSLQAMVKGAAGGETVTAAIRWYDGDDVFLDEATENWELTSAWALYKAEGKTAPVGAVSASVRITDAHPSIFYVDNVCLEEAATCGEFITPLDAHTTIANTGQMVAYPTYTITALDTLADGLTLTVGATELVYEGALGAEDVLTVETDQQMPDVKVNGARSWAGVTSGPPMPTLPVGMSALALTDPDKCRLTVAYRQRYL